MKLPVIPLLIISLITAGLTVTGGGSATAAAVPRGATYHEAFFPSGDGTMLHAEYLLPEGGCDDVVNADGTTGCPTVVSIGPYFGSGSQSTIVVPFPSPTYTGPVSRFFDFTTYEFAQPDGTTKNIFEMGYAWVQVDSRGYGSSGGCNDYGGHGEQMDAAAAVTWAGTQPWSNGNVGMWGKSYDGWTQVMALAENPPHLEATVIQAPLIEGYGIGYVNGVHHSAIWFATTYLYADYNYLPPALVDSMPEEHVWNAHGTATDPCWAHQQAELLNPDHDFYYWTERDLRPRAGRNDDVAVFWVHGFTDVNTKPDQVFGVYDGLTANSDKTRAWFGQWDHIRGSDQTRGADLEDDFPHEDWQVGRAGFNEEALDWLNHYLRGEPFAYEVNAQNLVEAQDNEGNWRTEATYPSTDVRRIDLPIRAGTYEDRNSSAGYWTVTPEVTDEFRITGESTVTLDVDITVPFAQFIGVLYDIAPNGEATEISRTAYRIEDSGTHTFQTHPGDWIMRQGHRLGFKVMSTHPQSQPYPTSQTVTINGGSVTMPIPEFEREINLGGMMTTSRSAYRTAISPAEIEAGLIEYDMDALGARPYTAADWAQGIPDPQGDLDASRPVE